MKSFFAPFMVAVLKVFRAVLDVLIFKVFISIVNFYNSLVIKMAFFGILTKEEKTTIDSFVVDGKKKIAYNKTCI